MSPGLPKLTGLYARGWLINERILDVDEDFRHAPNIANAGMAGNSS